MQRVPSSGLKRGRGGEPSFTLVELLTVMVIIALLVAITLWAAGGLMARAARARATGEIAAMSSSLEYYKIDNGIYPPGYVGTNSPTTGLLGSTNSSYSINPTSTNYTVSSEALYEALAGKTNYADTSVNKTYMNFKVTQLANYANAAGTAYSSANSTYIIDPWGYAYGYSTGDGTSNNVPVNGTNMFDLWTTGGLTANPSSSVYATNTWITNWRNM